MILPVFAYGQPVLRKKGVPVDLQDTELHSFIQNMWETMYNASGIGLAAPQVGKSLRIFIVDTAQMEEDGGGLKEVFINPEILSFGDEEDSYEEGCLSIPDVTGDVVRPTSVVVKYFNENLEEKEVELTGMEARVFQHEYDHVDGVLFTEKLKPLKRKRVQRRLEKIKKGQVSAKYKLKFV